MENNIDYYIDKGNNVGLNPYETSVLIELYKREGYKNREISHLIFLSINKRVNESLISLSLKLHSPEYYFVKEALENEEIKFTHGINLVRLSRTRAKNLLTKTIENNWTVKEMNKEITGKTINKDMLRWSEELFLKSTGVRCKIKKGKIIVDYDSVEMLTEIFKKLGIKES